MDKFAIGYIYATHGLNGYLKVKSFSGELNHFLKLKNVLLVKDEVTHNLDVEKVIFSNKNALIKFYNIANIDEAKKYTGYEIWVDKEYASKLKKDEFYVKDLINIKLIYKENIIGEIISVIEVADKSLFETKLNDGRKVLIPFQKAFIGEIDIKNKTAMLLEEWILG